MQALFDADDIRDAVARIGAEISHDHPDGVVLVAVLKGSIIFLADLVRALSVPCAVDFIAITRFAPDSGRVRIVMDLEQDISGESVVLVEDIVDTGLTLTYLLGHLEAMSPRSLRVCTMLDRTRRRIVPVPIDYRGFELDDAFVLGYGLDFDERYRNIDRLVPGDLRALQNDPLVHSDEFFPPAPST